MSFIYIASIYRVLIYILN